MTRSVPDTKKFDHPMLRGKADLTRAEAAVLSMFDAEALGEALEANGYDLREEIDLTVDIARNGSPMEQLRAMDRINYRQKQIAELNGLMVQGHVRVVQSDPETGAPVERTVTATRLVTSLRGQLTNDDSPFESRLRKPVASTVRSSNSDQPDEEAADDS